jgi:hypothetical protein
MRFSPRVGCGSMKDDTIFPTMVLLLFQNHGPTDLEQALSMGVY